MNHDTIRRRDLPHWDVPGATYFVTACLHGSIPSQGLLDIENFRAEQLNQKKSEDQTENEWQNQKWKHNFARTEEWLDRKPANRSLADARLAQVVVDAIDFYAGDRYDDLAFVVMPSHIHWVFRPLEIWERTLADDDRSPRERIMYTLKRFTANACNRLQQTRGQFWQAESFDHWIRDAEELERIIYYIEANPVKAGLASAPEKWQFSSAFARKQTGIPVGIPLPKRAPESAL